MSYPLLYYGRHVSLVIKFYNSRNKYLDMSIAQFLGKVNYRYINIYFTV